MIGAKLNDQRNSRNAGRFKSTNQRLASRRDFLGNCWRDEAEIWRRDRGKTHLSRLPFELLMKRLKNGEI